MSASTRPATPEARLSMLVDRCTGIVAEQKPYIRPFERVLAAAELAGLCGREPSFAAPAAEHVLLPAGADVETLRARLAYWQRVGSERLEPTLQVRLEASASGEDGRIPSRRLLRYGPHDLHAYRGKFFPQLVRALINMAGLAPGATLIDPMCGSGTTLVEARGLGMQAVGLDMNPLSVRIASAKAGVLDVDGAGLASAARRLLARAESRLPPRPRWAAEDRVYLERWFDARALDEVARLCAAIDGEPDPRLQALFLACLSDVLRGISWQVDADLRVRKRVGEYRAGQARRAFAERVERQVERLVPWLHAMGEHGPFPAARVVEGDARRVDETLRGLVGRCDLLISSPPYAMALPYLDTDRLSLCALGLLPRVGHRRREQAMIGNREISEAHRARLWAEYLERRACLPARACKLIDALAQVDHAPEVGFRRRNLPALLARYFLDMREVMASTLALMRPGARAFLVIGNNSTTVHGDRVEIPTDELLAEIGHGVGWRAGERLDMELLPSRDIFRRNRGSAERILGFRAPQPRRALYTNANVHADEDWSFAGADTQEHLHALHPWPARFIPQIPRRAIARWSAPGRRVLDPFAGAGTTLLEASLAGRPAIGIDNNAVAHLVARAKTHAYTRAQLRRLRRFAADVAAGALERTAPSIPEYTNREHWFCDAALADLGRLRAGVDALPGAPRLLARAVLSSIVLRASRQDSDTRYARVDRRYAPGRARAWFVARLGAALDRVESMLEHPRAPVECVLGDARALGSIPAGSIALVVTSPPYLNAYDYHKYHRHRLHWIGGDVALARDHEIGKHDTFTRRGAGPEPYFADIAACIDGWARVLAPGGRAVVVIGDAIVGGEPVAVGDRLVALLDARGLALEHRFVRRLDTGRKSFNQRARIDAEHVLVARRVPS